MTLAEKITLYISKFQNSSSEEKKAAFELLIEDTKPIIWKHIRGICQRISEDPQDDLYQEVCMKIWKKLGTLQSPRAYSRWIRVIVLNTYLSGLKSAPREIPSEDAEDKANLAQPFSRQAEARLFLCDVEEYIAGLPKPERDAWRAWLLHETEGKQYQGLAFTLGVPPSTLSLRVKTVLHKVRKHFGDKDFLSSAA